MFAAAGNCRGHNNPAYMRCFCAVLPLARVLRLRKDIMVVTVTGGKSRPRPRPSRASREDKRPQPTSPASPLAQFPPPPPAESRSRAPEFYGFVAWAVTYLLFALYFLWAILPDEWIIWLGVSWYPNRCVRSSSNCERANSPSLFSWAGSPYMPGAGDGTLF